MIPNTITQTNDLKYLTVSANHCTPHRMMDPSKLTNLVDLSMMGNNLIGKIPDWLGELANLKLLHLGPTI